MRRTAALSIGLLVVLCVVLVLAVGYPFSTSDPQSEAAPEHQFSFDDPDEYRITGSVSVDGQTQFDVDGVVTSDDERYVVIDWGQSISEEYQPGPGEDVYGRMVFEDETEADSWVDAADADDDTDVLHRERAGDETVVLFLEDGADDTDLSLANEAKVVLGSLSAASYERTHQADDTATYEPHDAWLERTNRHITDTSGYVAVDTETRAVTSADVSWEQTRLHRVTYLNYLLAAVVADESTTMAITYDLETDDVELAPPDWLPDAHEE